MFLPPVNYRDGREESRERQDRAGKSFDRAYDFLTAFLRLFLGGPTLFFLVLAGHGRDTGFLIAYYGMLLGFTLFCAWLLWRQRLERTSAFTTGLIWGAACGAVAFFVLARLVL